MSEDKVFSVDTPEESSGFLLWQVTAMWQREIRKALDPLDLTHTQFVLLASIMWLSQFEEPITQVKLAQHTQIDVMTTSSVVRTLLQKGLIDRTESAVDSRAKSLSINELGRVKAIEAIKAVEGADGTFFSILGTDVRELNNRLSRLLSRDN